MLVFMNKISRIVTLEEVENVQRIGQSGMCRTGRDGSRSSWGLFHHAGRFTTPGCRLGAGERKEAGERKWLERENSRSKLLMEVVRSRSEAMPDRSRMQFGRPLHPDNDKKDPPAGPR
jgi:hypothetical protein